MIWCSGSLLICLGLSLSPAAEPAPKKTPAQLLWDMGHESLLAGQADQAIGLFKQSLQFDPQLACNHLSLAAGYLAKDDPDTALQHLARYLELEPGHLAIREQYADMLFRLKRYPAAREQLERLVAGIQDVEELADKHLVGSHSRLMHIARVEQDDYAEHLNRGIALFWLACRQAAHPDEDSSEDAESLLCRAAAELSTARLSRPDETRPCWYLYEVWTRLGQSQPAQRSLRGAEGVATFTYLTPAEQRSLRLALRQFPGDRPSR